jgi:hypothetical protein
MGLAADDRVQRSFDLGVTIPANAHAIERLLEGSRLGDRLPNLARPASASHVGTRSGTPI